MTRMLSWNDRFSVADRGHRQGIESRASPCHSARTAFLPRQKRELKKHTASYSGLTEQRNEPRSGQPLHGKNLRSQHKKQTFQSKDEGRSPSSSYRKRDIYPDSAIIGAETMGGAGGRAATVVDLCLSQAVS